MWFKVWGLFQDFFFFAFYSGETSMLPLNFLSDKCAQAACVFPPSHFHLSKPVWTSMCQKRVQSSENLAPVSTRCFAGAPLRTEGHRDNYKTMSRWRASPACRALKVLPFPPHRLFLLFLFSPPPQTTDTGEWCQQAPPPWRELALGNGVKEFNRETTYRGGEEGDWWQKRRSGRSNYTKFLLSKTVINRINVQKRRHDKSENYT